MATTKEEIKQWLERGKNANATHIIIVCDTFDYEDYPVQVMPNENIQEKVNEYSNKSMQRIMEIYNLSLDIDEQLNQGRSFNL